MTNMPASISQLSYKSSKFQFKCIAIDLYMYAQLGNSGLTIFVFPIISKAILVCIVPHLHKFKFQTQGKKVHKPKDLAIGSSDLKFK